MATNIYTLGGYNHPSHQIDNVRKKQKEIKVFEDIDNEISYSNGIDEYIIELKEDALKAKKPSDFDISEKEILTKVETEYRDGKISKVTYEAIKEKYDKKNL